MAKEKITRNIEELSPELQLIVGALLDKRVQLAEIEKSVKEEKDENTEKFLDIIYDQLEIDGIKRIVGNVCQSVGITDRGPSIDKDRALVALKLYFTSKMKDLNKAMSEAERVSKELEKSKEERLRGILEGMGFPAEEVKKVIEDSQKETKLTVTLRITKPKKK